MTNFEYYKDKILEIVRGGDTVAISNTYKTLRRCDGLDCIDCCFNNSCEKCAAQLIKWLYEEHKEWPTLTRFQHDFLEKMAKKYNWMARDGFANSNFWFYENEPKERDNAPHCVWEFPDGAHHKIDGTLDDFDFIKWEDEPCNIRELLENCEVRG